MIDERGQALVLAALLLGIAAVTIVGIRAAQDRILAHARELRAGEAAVEAAATVIADAYVAHLTDVRARSSEKPPPTPDVPGLLAAPATRESARAAAAETAERNSAVFAGVVDARCVGRTIEVELMQGGRRHRAQLEASACFRP